MCTDVTTHSYTLTATDSISGLTGSISFQIVVSASAVTITNTAAPSAQTYVIGTTFTPIPVPTYDHLPACATVSYSYSLTTNPSTLIVSINGSNQITVSSSNGSDAKTYTVTVRTTLDGTSTTDDKTFTLTVTSDPTLTFAPITDVEYILGGTA